MTAMTLVTDSYIYDKVQNTLVFSFCLMKKQKPLQGSSIICFLYFVDVQKVQYLNHAFYNST